MLRRALLTLLAVAAFAPVVGNRAAVAAGPAYRPDAFIKLCGVNSGCKIDPLPHPWIGKNIYNTSGYHQKIHHRLDNGPRDPLLDHLPERRLTDRHVLVGWLHRQQALQDPAGACRQVEGSGWD